MAVWRPAGERSEVFRPWPILSWAMGAAGVFWTVSLIYLLSLPGAPAKLLMGAAVFSALFCTALAYYMRSAVIVDAHGVTFRGLLSSRRLLFRDIRKVSVLPGPVVVYAVAARGTWVHFTSFFSQHHRLLQLLIERSHLTG